MTEFVKKTWACGDNITADELNRMEDGIEEAISGGGTEPNAWVIETESFDCDTPVSKNLVRAKFDPSDSEVMNFVVAYSDMTEAEIMALDYIDASAIEALNQEMFNPAPQSLSKPIGASTRMLYSATSSTSIANLSTDTNAIICAVMGVANVTRLVILPTNADVRFNCK